MGIVRPNVGSGFTHGLLVAGCVLSLAAACVGSEGRNEAHSDTAVAARPANVPSAFVTEVPAWPADTTTFATDRSGALPARLRAKLPSCGATTPIVTGDSIGAFYPGQPLANLFGACARPLQLWAWDDGRYVPAVALTVGDAVLLLEASGVIPEAVVTRVTALEGARTAEGIGPGSLLPDVERAYGTPIWERDQCSVSATFASRPGLIVNVAIPEGHSDAWTCQEIRRFGAGTNFSRFPQGSTVGSVGADLGSG